jgi:hypothetical protein
MMLGLSLASRFFSECVEPLLRTHEPALQYAAALVGSGSEVLGFDTGMSADHDWGPRLQLFVPSSTFADIAPRLLEILERSLPSTFGGWPTRFVDRDRPTAEDAATEALGAAHGVEIFSVRGWTRRHLALDSAMPAGTEDWLALPEQALLEATAGRVFRDDLGELTALRDRLAYYPRDVWLFRLASQWRRIGEEQAFVGRTGEVGDDLGSRIIAARLLRDVLRLVFLIERAYAPYAKWLGSAFGALPSASRFSQHATQALAAATWTEREAALANCYRLAADLQIERGVPGALAPIVGRYFERPFTVINADEIAAGLRAEIGDPALKDRPLAGAVDQIADNVVVLANTSRARALMAGAPRS